MTARIVVAWARGGHPAHLRPGRNHPQGVDALHRLTRLTPVARSRRRSPASPAAVSAAAIGGEHQQRRPVEPDQRHLRCPVVRREPDHRVRQLQHLAQPADDHAHREGGPDEPADRGAQPNSATPIPPSTRRPAGRPAWRRSGTTPARRPARRRRRPARCRARWPRAPRRCRASVVDQRGRRPADPPQRGGQQRLDPQRGLLAAQPGHRETVKPVPISAAIISTVPK